MLIGIVGVIVALVVAGGVVVVIKEGSGSGTTATTSPSPRSHTSPAYLEALNSNGDSPELGLIDDGTRAYQRSIFYDSVGSPSTSSRCEMSNNCRFTSFQLDARYRLFTASFGIDTKSQNPAGLVPTATWHVWVDGRSVAEGEATANRPTTPVTVHLRDPHTLELGVSVNEPGIGETINVLWGDARVR